MGVMKTSCYWKRGLDAKIKPVRAPHIQSQQAFPPAPCTL